MKYRNKFELTRTRAEETLFSLILLKTTLFELKLRVVPMTEFLFIAGKELKFNV
jgi:hypothetical protein